jgi:hypothetical protein
MQMLAWYAASSVLQGARIWRDVDCVFPERRERNDLQCPRMGRCQDDRCRRAIEMSSQPVRRGNAPAIAGHEPRELVSGHRRAQIIADTPLMLEELSRHHCAYRVAAEVFGPGIATSVAVEPGDRVITAGLQFTAEHIAIVHR